MIRTQIQLPPVPHRRLRAAARREGVSLSELVRRSVDRLLTDRGADRRTRYARAAELVGRLVDPDGSTDLSRRHDDYLDESTR